MSNAHSDLTALLDLAETPFASGLPSAITHQDLGVHPGAQPLGKKWREGRAHSYRGIFGASTKVCGPPIFESLLERDFQTMLCVDPRISEYAIQSSQLIYWVPSAIGTQDQHKYTPDVCAVLTSGEKIVFEVKHSSLRRRRSWRNLEAHICHSYLHDHGIRFQVVTEREIRIQPRLANYQMMMRYAHPYDDTEAEIAVWDALRNFPMLTQVGDLCAATNLGAALSRKFSAIIRLAISGQITLDVTEPLSLASRVCVVQP